MRLKRRKKSILFLGVSVGSSLTQLQNRHPQNKNMHLTTAKITVNNVQAH